MKKYLFLIALIACSFETFSQERIPKEITGISATLAKNEHYVLTGSVGQPLIGRLSSSDFEVRGGYWEIAGILSKVNDYRGNELESFFLGQNYPNPFSDYTIIPFTLTKGTEIRIILYNSGGVMIKELINEQLVSGEYEYEINTNYLLPGTYYYCITVGNASMTKKMVKLE